MVMNKTDIINKINELTAELPTRRKIASIAEHEGLEIAFEELTNNCCELIKGEDYKESRSAIKSLEIVKNFKNYLKSQKDRIESIETQIAQLRLELTRCQLDLFEQGEQKVATGFQHNDSELYVGDVFECPDKSYLLIYESQEKPNNYVIIGTAFSEELLLQYPKNREILNNTAYLGNMYDNEKLAEFLNRLQEQEEELKSKEENTSEEEGEEE